MILIKYMHRVSDMLHSGKAAVSWPCCAVASKVGQYDNMISILRYIKIMIHFHEYCE